MSHYDYKVVPAPKRAKKVKGVRTAEELFALTLTDAINEVARQGWEYVRAEHLPAEASRGWFRAALAEEQTVLVFRRPRETLGPRLANARPEPAPEPHAPAPPAPDRPPTPDPAERTGEHAGERAIVDRMRRREPSVRLEPVAGDAATPPTPLRPAPRLGPADKGLGPRQLQRQGVDAAREIIREGGVDRPAALDPAEPIECRGPHHHLEVRAPTLAPAAVAAVHLALVDHLDLLRRERRHQLRAHRLRQWTSPWIVPFPPS